MKKGLIPRSKILDYEILSNPKVGMIRVGMISNNFLQNVIAKYFAWKVKRKWARYAESVRLYNIIHKDD